MEVSKSFQKILTKQGLQFKMEQKVLSADKSGPQIKVEIESVKNPGTKSTVCFFSSLFNLSYHVFD